MLENEQEFQNRLLPFFKLWRAHPQNAPRIGTSCWRTKSALTDVTLLYFTVLFPEKKNSCNSSSSPDHHQFPAQEKLVETRSHKSDKNTCLKISKDRRSRQ